MVKTEIVNSGLEKQSGTNAHIFEANLGYQQKAILPAKFYSKMWKKNHQEL